MELCVERQGEVTVVRPDQPRLDAMVAVLFKDRMKAAVEGAGARVVLDLSGVGFLDSTVWARWWRCSGSCGQSSGWSWRG